MKSLAYKAIAAAAFSVFAINSAQASNIDLTINGEVVSTTCMIDSTATSSKTITLAAVPASSLGADGQVAGPRKAETFNITGCAGTAVKINFDNQADFVGKNLKNVAVAAGGKNAATNVGIKLTNKDLSQLDLAAGGMSLPLTDGAASFEIGAEYIAVGGPATVGLVQGMLKMTVGHE